jgi:hypothetical protein
LSHVLLGLSFPAAAERFRGWPLAGILLRLNSLKLQHAGSLAASLLGSWRPKRARLLLGGSPTAAGSAYGATTS